MRMELFISEITAGASAHEETIKRAIKSIILYWQ